MELDVSEALSYESLARPELAARLKNYGIVLVLLSDSRVRALERAIRCVESSPAGRPIGRVLATVRMVAILPRIVAATLGLMLHPRLFEVVEFFILDRPVVWGIEPVAGGTLVRFQGRR